MTKEERYFNAKYDYEERLKGVVVRKKRAWRVRVIYFVGIAVVLFFVFRGLLPAAPANLSNESRMQTDVAGSEMAAEGTEE